MGQCYKPRRKEGGAVAIIVGLTIFVLLAAMGLSLDLGHAYITKTELQNAADAAALAGAKELNETLSGVTKAVAAATAIAAKHNHNFGTAISITAANVRLGSCPNANSANAFGRPEARVPSCAFVPASSILSDADAKGRRYIEIDTGNRSVNTYVMAAVSPSFKTTTSAGYAVAGRFLTDVVPLGVCAINPASKTSKYVYPTGMTELVEFGFRRGVSYNLFELNPLAGTTSDPYLLNPVDIEGSCDPSHSSANFTAPFMCNGSSGIGGIGKVYTNTGLTVKLEASLNSRFDKYTGPSVCKPDTSPPDSNVKEYPCNSNTVPGCENNAAKSPPTDWMQPGTTTLPNRQSVAINTATAKPAYSAPAAGVTPTTPNLGFDQYGVLWSYTRAYHADASTPPKEGAPFLLSEANGSVTYNTNGSTGAALQYFDPPPGGKKYPDSPGTGFPTGTPASPYNQTSGSFFKAPPNNPPGLQGRRLLKVVLVDCSSPPVGPPSCGQLNSVGIASFFMQVPADINKKTLYVEFAGLTEAKPFDEIKLYR